VSGLHNAIIASEAKRSTPEPGAAARWMASLSLAMTGRARAVAVTPKGQVQLAKLFGSPGAALRRRPGMSRVVAGPETATIRRRKARLQPNIRASLRRLNTRPARARATAPATEAKMQTLDLVVTHSRVGGSWRVSRQRKLLAVAALAALAAGGAAWLERPPAGPATVERPKLDARIPVVPDRAPTADDARMAAFQQSVALSFDKPLASVAGDPDPHRDAAAPRPAHPRYRALPTLAKGDVPAPRPEGPEVIVADLPSLPPPPAKPGYVDISLQAMGDAARRLALVPGQARDFTAAAVGRMSGALSEARARIGF